ncbi:phosphoribosylaminoimidazole carboxylase ATPase subunit [Lapidilactobacillus dextrinicus DSM 20335]|uniref:N5-carboxyaminoimidazole ribonucleotide synthase n=1 Tax=Lapidilactobacillus dextrinicus DSM 20335 TaxID=1423738 RepID=A0A0R2BIS5_9LACO|nr:5-(carboxyamino)imidazole ribonucleotide synthase [Lapidilactobacillus dextrinicus]KRM78434.1 phosphoribosylaminoimidazole carboxylase ATPase subunit [Lapidilactobacillus dextrinicus DSM 20335]QFG47234.1 5-(carboxyamino)imidazole ribonucleotide synthase [Lapidilactobacillus dextrinicus]
MKVDTITPPATIGIIGGGQLGRMMSEAAKPLGYNVIILDPQPNAPAGQVADDQIVAEYADHVALAQLAQKCDVVTYEFENVDLAGLESIQTKVAIPQGTEILRITANRLLEKTFLKETGIPVTEFRAVSNLQDLPQLVQEIGLPVILKTVAGGYDGHGQWDINTSADIDEILAHQHAFAGLDLILEKRLLFDQELSIMVTRDGRDQIVTWPVAQNQHQDHILKITTVNQNLAPQLQKQAQQYAEKIARALDLRGVLGIELFLVGSKLVVNELAPRPHNSGHYSIEGCNVSQFEGHIRSIMGLPIAPITLIDPEVRMINLLGSQMIQARHDLVAHPEWHFHDYQKDQVKPKRKLGHITVLGQKNCQNLQMWEEVHHDIN